MNVDGLVQSQMCFGRVFQRVGAVREKALRWCGVWVFMVGKRHLPQLIQLNRACGRECGGGEGCRCRRGLEEV